ncbi:hypothetical protein NUACC21_10490 [Scytonema sp. NUACC21]
MGCQTLSVSFEPTGLEKSSPSVERTLETRSPASSSVSTSSSSVPPSNLIDNSSKEALSTVVAYDRENNGKKAAIPGSLRMSNKTNQPVRLALLSRRSLGKGTSSQEANDAIPAHWDFAPQEGTEKGLILALPNGNLKLEKGDILVAFAQDGSRRYWGPYVVGETSFPNWNSQSKEWQLVLNQ